MVSEQPGGSSSGGDPLEGLEPLDLNEFAEPPEPGHHGSERLSVLVAGGILLVVAVGYLVVGHAYPVGSLGQPGPGIFPLGIGVLFVVSAAGVVMESVRDRGTATVSWPFLAYALRLGLVLLASVGYIVLLPILGQLITGGLLCAALLVAMRSRHWWLTVLLSVAFTISVQVLFGDVLNVPLPRGILYL